jgi:hypothetical protein
MPINWKEVIMHYEYSISRYEKEQLNKISKEIMLMDKDHPSTVAMVFEDKSRIDVIGGHPFRVILIASNLRNKSIRITGRLLDPQIPDFDIKVKFSLHGHKFSDHHSLKDTVTKQMAIQVIIEYLQIREFDTDYEWRC